MSILLLEARGVRKSFAGAEILDVKSFRVYAGDKIGFVGANGSGKSTLLSILAGELSPDEGYVERGCDVAYIRQFESQNETAAPEANTHSSDLDFSLSLLGVQDKAGRDNVSGGEATRLKIARAFDSRHQLIFADEPTSNLDTEGVERFGEMLTDLESFILISHDRDLLNRHCNKIITLEDRDIAEYSGGFDEYRRQAEAKLERSRFEYEQYTEEKRRLENVYSDKKAKAAKVTKKPKSVSAGDQKARAFGVTRRSFDGRQRSFESAARNVQMRIDHLEAKERPAETARMKLDFALTDPPSNKTVLSGSGINFSYPSGLAVFGEAEFEIKNGERAAIQGPNGSGKTTLFNLINSGHDSIYKVPKARVGYFYQGFENLDMKRTVLQNAMEDSVQKEPVVRSVLARLLFNRTTVDKPAGVLSGGERIKLSLAKLLVSNRNVLMLDEPTNYLDMPSIEILQAMLCEYEGTLLFVSHDRAFTDAVATVKLAIKDKKIIRTAETNAPQENEMLREYRLASLAGQMATASGEEKERMMKEYMELKAGMN